jgi:hypothetical protein
MWSSLGESALAELLWHALVIYEITDDVQRTGPLSDLYTVAIHRLSPEARVGVIQRLAEYSEQSRRDGRYVSGVSFLAAIKMDPDFRVASTAVLNSAVLLGHAEDPMMGRRHAHQLAIETEDPERRAWLLCGLVTLADAQTLALLRAMLAWAHCRWTEPARRDGRSTALCERGGVSAGLGRRRARSRR